MKVKFIHLSALSRVPTKATPGSARYDVNSPVDIMIRPGGTEQIPLDIAVKLPKKYLCRVYPRSSVSVLKTFLGGEVIDSDYRGNISIILTNFGALNFEIKNRIAQVMFLRPQEVVFDEVEEFTDRTSQGTGGFGSTNKLLWQWKFWSNK